MARGNQREKAREKNMKDQAGQVSRITLLLLLTDNLESTSGLCVRIGADFATTA